MYITFDRAYKSKQKIEGWRTEKKGKERKDEKEEKERKNNSWTTYEPISR